MDILFACWAITNVIVNSNLLDFIRRYEKTPNKIIDLISCVTCSGFWVGFLFFIVLYDSNPVQERFIFSGHLLLDSIVFGFLSSGFSTLVNSLLIYLLSQKN